jgi:hypothetical protein
MDTNFCLSHYESEELIMELLDLRILEYYRILLR